ncbi:Wadjet anti-phage system protein JetD domain-containing protein [Paenarthrobacter sp.]|uniref:Wadjet anti-phage system protein JetD domain-containing protein n=1 Tax=Paenarthrobacter sp. TaxID=1931993 RepID=UPI0028128A2A|nr:Wadjet anti-phage system protein JetD domain-containing protein [Paenarthrobacter sp.]
MPAKSAPARRWTTLAGLRSLSVTAWDRGQLLREALEPTDVYPRRRALKRPSATELRDHYAAAREWAAELFAAAGRYSLETVDVGRTTIGSNQLPAVAMFASVEDEVAFVGKSRELERFRSLASSLVALDPALTGWALKRPLALLALGDAALTAARVALWLRDHHSPAIYVRQLSLPGVHTKFIEAHRRTIDEMAAVLEPPEGSDQFPGGAPDDEILEVADSSAADEYLLGRPLARTPAARFAERHGFLHQPEQVRFRALDSAIPLLGDARDITVTATAFESLRLPVSTVIITENLVNFLALPDRPATLAIFGAGYGFSCLRDAAWLQACEVLYWGDLDTHGFRILDQLRLVHPHVSSVLMDEETLLAHRDAWGVEATPSRAVLSRLTPEEARVYEGLQTGSYGDKVRLEQELMGWEWALARLSRGR